MEKRNWMKAIYQSYKYITRITNAIDKQVIGKGVGSYTSMGFSETLNVAYDILKLIEHKQCLLELKNLIDDCIKNLTEENGKILMLHYIDKASINDLSYIFSCSERTVRRKIDKALNESYKYFCGQGYDLTTLQTFLKNEVWITKIYNNVTTLSNARMLPSKKEDKLNPRTYNFTHCYWA